MRFWTAALAVAVTCADPAGALEYVDISGKTNLLPNAGFEIPHETNIRPEGWSFQTPGTNTFGWEYAYIADEEAAHSGTYSVVFSNVFSRGHWSTRMQLRTDHLMISNTNHYLLRIRYKTRDLDDGQALARLRFYTAAGTEIWSDMIPLDAVGPEWSTYDHFVTPPEATETVALFVYLDHARGAVHWDDLGLYQLTAEEVELLGPYGRYSAPAVATNGVLPQFTTNTQVSVQQDGDGVWWFVATNGVPFYRTATSLSLNENTNLTSYVLQVRDLSLHDYRREILARAKNDLNFNGNVREADHEATEKAMVWLNFSTEAAIEGTNWVLRNANGDTFGGAKHYFPDPFSPAWQAHATQEVSQIEAWMLEDPNLIGYWTDNEWAYGAMWEYFWSDNCRTALVTWLQGDLAVPDGFEIETPYPDIETLNAAWSSPYHTYTYTSFNDIYGTDKPQIRAFDDPVMDDLHAFERVVFKTYADTVIGAIRDREDELIAELDAEGSTGTHRLIASCRIGWEGPGFHDDCLRRNIDIFSAFDLIAVNAYPTFREAADHYPRSQLEAMRRTFHDTTGRPVIISEFGVAARDAGIPVQRWFDRTVNTQSERGEAYRNIATTLANLPWVVGHSWYRWCNAYGEEDAPDPRNSGLVNDQDRYYTNLTDVVREVNAALNAVRRASTFGPDDIDWRDTALPVYERFAPTLEFLTPLPPGGAAFGDVSMSWHAEDPDSEASITLYASTNAATAANTDPIASNLVVGVDTEFVWDVSQVAAGTYTIVACVDDHTGPPVCVENLPVEVLGTPTPDILVDVTVQGSNGPVVVNQPDYVFVDLELLAGDLQGYEADWWVVATTPMAPPYDVIWYYLGPDGRAWWKEGLEVTATGAVADLTPPYNVVAANWLPLGVWTVYFGVDLNPNGILEMERTIFDAAQFTVEP